MVDQSRCGGDIGLPSRQGRRWRGCRLAFDVASCYLAKARATMPHILPRWVVHPLPSVRDYPPRRTGKLAKARLSQLAKEGWCGVAPFSYQKSLIKIIKFKRNYCVRIYMISEHSHGNNCIVIFTLPHTNQTRI